MRRVGVKRRAVAQDWVWEELYGEVMMADGTLREELPRELRRQWGEQAVL